LAAVLRPLKILSLRRAETQVCTRIPTAARLLRETTSRPGRDAFVKPADRRFRAHSSPGDPAKVLHEPSCAL